MADKTLQLEIPVLLPEVEDERDQCVARLQEQLSQRKGVSRIHVDRKDGEACLCIHYDADLVALSQVQRWAEQAGAQVTERYRHARVRITDMDCADCACSIEHILGRQDGLLDVSVNYAAEKMWVEYDTTALDHDAIIRRVQDIGYTVEEEEAPRGWVRENWQLVLSIASGIFLAAGFFGETFLGLPRPAAIGLYVLAYLAGGADATRHGFHAARNLRFDIDFLMVVAAIGAAILGQWAEGALLLFLFGLGHALEHYAMDRARRAIEALGEITPKTARVQRDGRETEAPVEELLRGDVVIVRPGERVPIDGEVIDGQSAVDQSPITGESVPVEKEPGDEVFAGTVNGESTLEIEVTKLAQDTTLSRVIQMVEEAQAQKSSTQQFTDRFTRIFVPAVLIGVVLVIAVPPLIGWLPWQAAFLRGMTILVAASPCALAIATPAAVLSGVAQAARNGVLIKGGVHLENLGALEALAFDKTGTITRGEP
ncbi:MAG: HAD-IC family P-type ATPase, partial [Anaerolineae bacterium]